MADEAQTDVKPKIENNADSSGYKDGSSPPPAKKQKIHKRKLKKMNAKPQLNVVEAPVTVSAIRGLVAGLAVGQTSKAVKGFQVSEPQKIQSIVVCYAPGVLRTDFGSAGEGEAVSLQGIGENGQLRFFHDKSFKAVSLKYPGKTNEVFSAQRVLVNEKLTRSEKSALVEASAAKSLSIDDLLMRMPEWADHDYKYFPGSGQTLPADWFQTEDLGRDPKVLALDCEFCQTKKGSQLARISVLDFDENVLYDEYVKPEEEVTDYRTQFSGITEELMNKAATTQTDVRKKLGELVSASDTLVGHSLSFDLNVLKMSHPRVVDTCVIFDHPRKPPFKASLKWLSKTYLNRSIQEGEQTKEGHSSVEDCIACIDLVKLKLAKGALFGQEPEDIPISSTFKVKGKASFAIFDKQMADWGVSPIFGESLDQVITENDDDVVRKLTSSKAKVKFCSLSDLATGEIEPKEASLSDRLDKIWESLPENSLLIVVGGNVVDPKVNELQAVKRKYAWLRKQGHELEPDQVWTDEKAATLTKLCEEARQSVCLFGIKST